MGPYGTVGSDLWLIEPWIGPGHVTVNVGECLDWEAMRLGALEAFLPSERTLRGAGEGRQAHAWQVGSSNTPATRACGLLEGMVLCD